MERTESEVRHQLMNTVGGGVNSELENMQADLETLVHGAPTVEEQRSLVESLLSSVTKGQYHLERLFGWVARTHYCEVLGEEARKNHLNVHAFVNIAISALRHMANRKGIAVINNVASSLTVNADLSQALFVLRFAIGNAIKFSHPHNRVFVSADMKIAAVEISVVDFGAGIPREQLALLFHADDSTPSAEQGTENTIGFGLMLCKELVERNDGEMRIESSEGEGTRFAFSLERPISETRYAPQLPRGRR